jgi:hypothetical protein
MTLTLTDDDVRAQWDLLCTEVDALDDDLLVRKQSLGAASTDVSRRGVEQATLRCERARSAILLFLNGLD